MLRLRPVAADPLQQRKLMVNRKTQQWGTDFDHAEDLGHARAWRVR